jgi:hypothetical protein
MTQKIELKTKVSVRKTAISFQFFLAKALPLSKLFDADVAELYLGAMSQETDVAFFP